ncbi:hypothetical protein DPMN_120458 [Dreissena polymorpha]|uniref:Uncharacterized protein n=1 Tax=Dreissena polymorpha TaxID=45954 RepID=A0A9D4JS47_DREPO|nr:hypothetical protein DPMN_120458 [Dreissena polymorpha]
MRNDTFAKGDSDNDESDEEEMEVSDVCIDTVIRAGIQKAHFENLKLDLKRISKQIVYKRYNT